MLSKLVQSGPGCGLLVSVTIDPVAFRNDVLILHNVSRDFTESSGGITYALACAAVAENLAVVLVSSSDLRPSNNWTSKTGSKEVSGSIVSWRWPNEEYRRVKRGGAEVLSRNHKKATPVPRFSPTAQSSDVNGGGRGSIKLTGPHRWRCLLFTAVSHVHTKPRPPAVSEHGRERRHTLDGAEDKFIDEFLLQVVDNHALGTESQSLLLNGSKVFNLAYIGEEGLEATWVSIGFETDYDEK